MESAFSGFAKGTGITLGVKSAQSIVYPGVPWEEIIAIAKRVEGIRGIGEAPDLIGREGMFPGGELKIEIDHSSFENQTNRFVTELGHSKIEAENISKAVRDLTEAKINEQGKNWSKTVREAFANLMTAILIEEVKTISPTLGKPKSLSIAQETYLAAEFGKTTRYTYRQAGISSKSVSYAPTLDTETVNILRGKLYPDRI
jgi:hypothetical protein